MMVFQPFESFKKWPHSKFPKVFPIFPEPVSSSGICPPWPKLWSIQLRNADLGGWRSGDHQRLIVYHPRWCRISAINSIAVIQILLRETYCCDMLMLKLLVESQFHRVSGHVRVQLLTQTLLDSAILTQTNLIPLPIQFHGFTCHVTRL